MMVDPVGSAGKYSQTWLYGLQENLGGCCSTAVVAGFQDIGSQLSVFPDQPFLHSSVRVPHQKHTHPVEPEELYQTVLIVVLSAGVIEIIEQDFSAFHGGKVLRYRLRDMIILFDPFLVSIVIAVIVGDEKSIYTADALAEEEGIHLMVLGWFAGIYQDIVPVERLPDQNGIPLPYIDKDSSANGWNRPPIMNRRNRNAVRRICFFFLYTRMAEST